MTEFIFMLTHNDVTRKDAIKVYENILCYGYKRNRDFDSYIHHNLASLYLVLCQDEKAKKHFELKAYL